MDHYERANFLYENRKLEQALEQFLIFIQSGKIPPKKLNTAIERILEIYGQDGDGPDQRAPGKGELLSKLMEALDRQGRLAEFYQRSYECLEHYFRRKNVKEGLPLVERLLQQYPKDFTFSLFRTKFFILQNNHDRMDECLRSLMDELERRGKTLGRDGITLSGVYRELKDVLKENYSDDKSSVVLREFIMRGILAEWEDKVSEGKEEDLEEKRIVFTKLLHMIVENFLLDPLYLPNFYLALKFYWHLGHKDVCLQLAKFLDSKKHDRTHKEFKRIEKAFHALKSLVMTMKEERTERLFPWEEGALASGEVTMTVPGPDGPMGDIFSALAAGNAEDPVKRLEDLMKAQFNQGKFAAARATALELDKLDEGNGLSSSILGKMADMDNEGKKSEDIVKGLLFNIPRYFPESDKRQSVKEKREVEFLEKVLKKYFTGEEATTYEGIFKDLVVAFMVTGLPEVSAAILERLERGMEGKHALEAEKLGGEGLSSHTIRSYVDIQYLKIATLAQKEHYSEAEALAEYVNRSMPLNKGERVCFLYLQATLLLKMGLMKKSLGLLRKVMELDEDYRSVGQLVRELEKGK